MGKFPENFRQGFFLHPPSLFVADVFRKELYVLFNSQKEIQVFNLAGEGKIRTLDLPESQWLNYRLKYIEGEFESSQDAMMALHEDLETRRAYANEYYQGIKIDSERIRMLGTGIKDIGKLNFVPHNFVFDYYPERNAYAEVLVDTGRLSFTYQFDSDTLYYIKALSREKAIIVSGLVERN